MLPAVRTAVYTSDIDPHDGGWADIAFFVSPFFAIAGAAVIGIVLIVVAATGLIGLPVRAAGGALVIGLIGAPVIYVAVLLATASAQDAARSSVVLAVMTYVFPVVCGIGATLIAAFILGRRTSD